MRNAAGAVRIALTRSATALPLAGHLARVHSRHPVPALAPS